MPTLKNKLKNRTPVRRKHAVTHLLITLLGFAFSVTATRVFLNLTGYPQLGGGELHIAHVLWGGLFLFTASLLPLIWVNPWVLTLSAAISGVGVGLFIDEVGKFITAANNYFFPSAAPIIYAFFLLTVLVFVQVRRRRSFDSRAVMYGILEDFAEVLDHDLSKLEHDHLMSELNRVLHENEDTQLVNLARSLEVYLRSKETAITKDEPDFTERIEHVWDRFSTRWLTRSKTRLYLIIGLSIWAAWAIASQTTMYLSTHNVQQFALLVKEFMANQLIRSANGMSWFEAQILMEGAMGIIALVSVVLFLTRHDKLAVWFGITDMVFTLVVVNLITFYFAQFSTITFAAVQFLLLVLLLYYKRRYLDNKVRQ